MFVFLRRHLISAYPGSVELAVVRKDGKKPNELKVRVSIGMAPKSFESIPEVAVKELGIGVKEVNLDYVIRRGLQPDFRGIVISSVYPYGVGFLAGLEVEDIIIGVEGNPVDSVEELCKLVKKIVSEKKELLNVKVIRGRKEKEIEVEMTW